MTPLHKHYATPFPNVTPPPLVPCDKHCAVCQKVRLGQGKVISAVKTTAVSQPFLHLMWDTMGPFEPDDLGNKYVIAVLDRFTRFIELVPTTEPTSIAAAHALLHVVGRYGLFESIHSDKGKQFDSAVIKQFLKLLNIEPTYGAAYHPQAQGVVERSNREAVKHLRALVISLNKGANWTCHLPLVQRIYNSLPNRSIGCAPAKLLHGDAIDLDRCLLTVPDNVDTL